ncbi:hypothetical protein LCGC14_0797880 [marine sediment metagenome]|uniref:HNH nuclease domain-containing protein n=1 Tax=marine sediment metagenome TaxID=412755 RepID=A0A0F9QAD6_9ZZZZ|nr:MerR family transcriptional regulator [bacterium]
METLYKNEEWLYKKYVTEDKTFKEIGRICSVSYNTIRYWVKKFKIPIKESNSYIYKTRKYSDKKWLFNQYITQEKSTIDIAKEIGTNHSTICFWLKKFGIKTRRMDSKVNILYRDKEWLYNQYITQKKSTYEIAQMIWSTEKITISPMTVFYWLKKHKIKTRTLSESAINKPREKTSNWKGNNKKVKNGYIRIYKPEHSYIDKNGYISEHRLIIEKHIERYLNQKEIVHHINEVKNDNRIENLFLCKNNTEHSNIHIQIQKLAIEIFKSKKRYGIIFNKEKRKYTLF